MTTIGKIKIMLANLPDDGIVEDFHMNIKNVTVDQISTAADAHNSAK